MIRSSRRYFSGSQRFDRSLTICQNYDIMPETVETRTSEGAEATEVILATFRANGLLLAAGDRLAAEHGLTSARWQVLGAIALAQRPLTVPQIARRMGLTRQSVHTTVNRLLADGLVELVPNADHRRSQLVRLTELGEARYRAIDEKQAVWVNELASGVGRSELETTARVLGELCMRLEAGSRAIPQRRKGEDRHAA
jgi:DNA-binding MarR family transcriptional regulator